MNEKTVLDSVTRVLKEELTNALVGIYLHGSMAMGCFHPNQSDIDILVVSREKRTADTYRRIAKKLMHIEDEMHITKGFELSIVLESTIVNMAYPTLFEFHYSAYHREKYRTDEQYLCGGYEDPDLVAHMAVIYDRGIVLDGKPIKDLFQPENREHMIASITSDASSAIEKIVENPVYYVLSLSRVLLYVRDSVIHSKREAGEWALTDLPSKYTDVISQCLAKYNGDLENVNLSKALLLEYAEYMLNQIQAKGD
ncbi:aminoglycoside adenylyltransferase domain-containing protein [Paenibacillus sp. UASWS1643]|uniref:aminoglycoside adenylyltransferase domain-containing protein n=1 Tax=Paenibacillus sp. UASWS1643 TaxID=2580422 RepID=UPI001CC31507|nr:aminoglycoside adenylyltransferase domain-containing protein [Paenibacillus sp. UASWS1643]